MPWVGGGNAGGQGSIKVVGDVTRAGYNLLNSRGVTDTSSIPRASCGNRLTLPNLVLAAGRSGLRDPRAR